MMPPTDLLIPVSALNEVTYCPRSYYLQYVDGVRIANEHTEAGQFDHRRVDAAELAGKSRSEGGVRISRSISLSSQNLGISGILDAVEESSDGVAPVETKHGTAPPARDDRPPYWENDAIQLCAQGLLLEEAYGKPVPRGYLYYAGSRERVEVPLSDELRRKTLQAIDLCRELARQETPPPPLPADQRHKCFGCAAAPVCLPEETLYQLNPPPAATPEASPAEESPPSSTERSAPSSSAGPATPLVRVIPQSDDGAVAYLQEPGSFVGKRGEHLVVKKDGQEIQKVPMHAVRHVVVMGNVQMSTQAMETLAANGITISYLNSYGRFVGAFVPAPSKNVSLREQQFRKFADPATCLALARSVVRAKIANQRAFLMRHLREADAPGRNDPAAQEMAALLQRVDDAPSIESLLGIEGQAAAVYFGNFGRLLKSPPAGRTFDFNGRNRRPPRDPVNALLSFAYALLAKDCFHAVCTVGFDPYKGFFHAGRYGRPSLALDLMEEFRTIIADSVVLTLINNQMLTPDDFIIWRDACHLSERGRKTFFVTYEQRKASVVTHPLYGYRMSYSRMLEVQARMLAAYVRGNIPQYTGFTVR